MKIQVISKLSRLGLLITLLAVAGILGCNVANQKDSIDLEGTIVFSMIPEGEERWHLFSINPDGTGLEQLTSVNISRDERFVQDDFSVFNPSFNHDGSKILMNVLGGVSAPMIAYMNVGNRFLWSFEFCSNTYCRLSGENPKWSPDESKIIYWHSHSTENPIVYDINEEENTYLGYEFTDELFENKTMYGPTSPSWSADGFRIVFKELNDIYVCDADGGNLRRITNSDEEIFSKPVWHPESHKVAVRLRNPGDELNSGLYQIEVETGNMELLMRDNDAVMSLIPQAWSRDGNYILVTGRLRGELLSGLKIFDINKKEFIQVYSTESNIIGADMFLELEN